MKSKLSNRDDLLHNSVKQLLEVTPEEHLTQILNNEINKVRIFVRYGTTKEVREWAKNIINWCELFLSELKKKVEIRLYTNSNQESKKAKALLKEAGIPFKENNIEKLGLQAYYWKDLGTTKLPVLALPGMCVFYVGVEGVKKFIKKAKAMGGRRL